MEKEIHELLKIENDNTTIFTNKELKMIDDYINELEAYKYNMDRDYLRLEQENKKLKEENEFLKSEIEEAKRIFQKYLEYIDERDERINKAIKYIEYNNETLYTYEPDYDYEENMVDNYDISNYREDLLKILKGGKND